MLLAFIKELDQLNGETTGETLHRADRFLLSLGARKAREYFHIRGVSYRSRSHPRRHYALVQDLQAGDQVVAIESTGSNFHAGPTYRRHLFHQRYLMMSMFNFKGITYELPHFTVRLSRGIFYPRDGSAFIEVKCKCGVTNKSRRCCEMLSLMMEGLGLSFRGMAHRKSERFARRYDGFYRKTLYLGAFLKRGS